MGLWQLCEEMSPTTGAVSEPAHRTSLSRKAVGREWVRDGRRFLTDLTGLKQSRIQTRKKVRFV